MTSPLAVVGLTWDGYDVQRSDLDVFLEIKEGLDELPELRAHRQVIPFRHGMRADAPLAHRRVIVLEGLLSGPSATERSGYRGYVDEVKAAFTPFRATPGTLVATLEDGTTRWIKAMPIDMRPVPIVPGAANTSIELIADDPFWYSAYGIATLDAGPIVPVSGTYAASALALDPLACYQLGEAAGTSAVDASGNGLTGTYVGSPTLGAAGLLTGDSDTAVRFGGAATNQYLTAPVLGLIEHTIALWFDARGTPDGSGGVTHHTLAYRVQGLRGHLYLKADGTQIQYEVANGAAGGASKLLIWTASPTIQQNERHFYTATYDGVTMRIYVDGVEKTSDTVAPYVAGVLAAHFGNIGGGGLQANGVMDELVIWDTALSSDEIAALYADGTTAHYEATAPLNLDEGEYLDQSGEVYVTPASEAHPVSFDAMSTAEVDRVRVRFTGPSTSAPGIEVDTPEGIVGFVMTSALTAGQTLVVDNYAGTALIGTVSQRQHMTLKPANRYAEYARLRPGLNVVRILGKPASARIRFPVTHL